VMADIPGIIEGAHAGKGLGSRFLRHIERNAVLLFMVPVDTDNLKQAYEILMNELKLHNPELLDKRRVIAITKCDMIDAELEEALKAEVPADKHADGTPVPVVFISSVSGKGIDALKDTLWMQMNERSFLSRT